MTTENFEDEYSYDEPTIKIDGTGYIPDWMIPNVLEIYSEEMDKETAQLIQEF